MPSPRVAGKSVVVTGATGYVGQHLVSALAERGFDIRCLVRRSAEAGDVDFLRSCGVKIFVGELAGLDSESSMAFRGADLAVHLVGSIAPHRGQTLQELNADQTQTMVDDCITYQVPRVLLVSALGTGERTKSEYHASKWLSEQSVRTSPLKHIIARPSLIVGRKVGRRNSKLIERYINLILSRPVVPLIEGGSNKVQPIFVGDLAEALAALIASDQFDGRAVELGGAEIVSIRQIVETLMTVLDVQKPLRAIPTPIAKLVALYCQLFQEVPLVSMDQVKLASFDNICRENRLEVLIGKRPVTVLNAMAVYRDMRPEGQ